jgi:thymidylate synthase
MSYTQEENLTSADVAYNHINVQVFHLLEDLEAAGQTSSPRGLKTKEANLATLDIDPIYSVMDFVPRKFNWRYFAGELAWYLKADTSIEFINNFSSFWKDICPNGHANSNYGSLLFDVHPSQKVSDFDGSKIPNREFHNQLEWVYTSLVKDKNTRQAVAFFNTPYFQYPGNKDFVCTMYINFWIRKDYLDMKVQMRSNDIFFGLTYDAPWFSTIMQSMYLNLKEVYPELKLGIYYHCADNVHFYERHFELADKILDNPLNSSIKLNLIHPIFRFEPWEHEVGSEKVLGHKMYISEEAVSYIKIIDDLVTEGNLPKDQSYWKNTLGYLYEVTGDSPEASESK